jgi:cell division protein FtsZ
MASGENRAVEAAKQAIQSPLLETTIVGTKGVLLNITGGTSLSLFEVNEAAEIVQDASDPEANIIFGAVIDESLKDEIRITVIATGFDEEPGEVVKEEKVQVKTEEKKAEEVPVTETVEAEAVTEVVEDKTVPANEPGEFDIPTFLRRKR